jgi:ribosome maturation factor RimP
MTTSGIEYAGEGQMTTTHETIREVIEPWLNAERVELDDLEFVGAGKGRIVRVLVDADGGVDIDRIAELSQGLSALLDAETDIDETYRLEVSSPGLERSLRSPKHYQKSLGRDVAVKIRRDGAGATFKGVLKSVDESGFVVEVSGADQRVSFDEVTSARTVFTWKASPKPGKKKPADADRSGGSGSKSSRGGANASSVRTDKKS